MQRAHLLPSSSALLQAFCTCARSGLVMLAFVWVAQAAGARADDELMLRWQAPRGCPDQAWARARVEERLARPLASVPVGLVAEVTLRSEGRAHIAHVLTALAEGDVGERSLRGASCREVAEAAALVLSLTVASSAEAQSEPAPAPTPEGGHQLSDDELAPFLTPRPRVGRPARPRPFALGASLVVDQGARDVPAVGPGAYLAYEHARLRVELGGIYLPPGAVDPPAGSAARLDVSLVAARLGACGRVLGTRRFALSTCGHAELGGQYGSARRLGAGGDASALWAGAELSLRATWALTELLEGAISAGGLAVIHRPRFLVLGGDGEGIVVQRSWPVSARVALQLGARF